MDTKKIQLCDFLVGISLESFNESLTWTPILECYDWILIPSLFG